MKDIKKAYEKTEEISRKIWLAGLGAYGQSFDNLQNGYEKVNAETRGFFEKLVARGEELESQTQKILSETQQAAVEKTNAALSAQKEKLSASAEKLQSLTKDIPLGKLKSDSIPLDKLSDSIHHRLETIRKRVDAFVPAVISREQLRTLNEKIDELSAQAAQSKTEPKPKTPRKRAAATKKPTAAAPGKEMPNSGESNPE